MTTSNTLLPGNNHFIPLDQAKTMTASYRANKEEILAGQYQAQNILPLSETFNREAVDQLVATQGCAGIRIYYGMDESLKIHAIIVAVNESNQDILPVSAQDTSASADDPVIIEEGQRCPPICPEKSSLNS
jgi:hypothetical protein